MNRVKETTLKRIFALLLTVIIAGVSLYVSDNTIYSQAKDEIKNLNDLNKARDSVYDKYVKSLSSRKNELTKGKLTIGKYTMTYTVKIIGNPGTNGYPIYFGLHGGGNPDTKIQKEQYELMCDYYNYSITSGIYIVPLSLEARYDEHYLPESFLFYDRLIEDAVLFNNGDPNRVYFMGFSSGGDGVYAIAPLYADKLAAANMSAGFPHVHRLENLYNLPMCLQVGENDDAFDRNINVALYDSWLNDLNKKYSGGFTHETFIHKNGTHNSWNDVTNSNQMVVTKATIADWLKNKSKAKYANANTDAVKWVSKYTRNPWPKKVVWATNVNVASRESKAFYWLDRDGLLDYTTVVASYDKSKNTIKVEQCDATEGKLKIYLNSNMVDLFKDVKVIVGGKTYTVKPVISQQIMESTLAARGDVNYMFDAEIDITFAANKNNIKVEAVSQHKDEYELTGASSLLRWTKDDLFLVDGSLFGLTPDQLAKKLELNLPKAEKWEYWGKDLTWTYYDFSKDHSVTFFFQNNKCVIIYNERQGAILAKVKNAAASVLGAKFTYDGLPTTEAEYGILTMNNNCRFYIENNVYDNKDHMLQKYVHFSYREW